MWQRGKGKFSSAPINLVREASTFPSVNISWRLKIQARDYFPLGANNGSKSKNQRIKLGGSKKKPIFAT